ncbi:MAG: hypothetical protein JXB04_09275, partial [Kiritimatiellae bacterium]|nr:hypothetical protein [Kiritimatiellia bacterium]
MKRWTRFAALLALAGSAAWLAGCAPRLVRPPQPMAAADWARPENWEVAMNPDAKSQLSSVPGLFDDALRVDFELGRTHSYVQLKKVVDTSPPPDTPLTFLLRTDAACDLEVKFVDQDGSTHGVKIAMRDEFADWTRVTAYSKDLEYWWGGDENLGNIREYHLAFSGTETRGTAEVDDVGLGRPGMPSSFVGPGADRDALRREGLFVTARGGALIDPDAELPGLGFRQRRDAELTPEDPLVLEWLKIVQDTSAPGRDILGTAENNQGQTFNNSLVAMAFLLKGEKERAERILDFYASRTDRNNQDPTLQNFFYKGEARGFFQHVEINQNGKIAAFHHDGKADRWMGDMAWMLFAYKYYEQLHGPERYREITGLIYD